MGRSYWRADAQWMTGENNEMTKRLVMRFNLSQFIFLQMFNKVIKPTLVTLKLQIKANPTETWMNWPLLCFTNCCTSHSVKLFPMPYFLTLRRNLWRFSNKFKTPKILQSNLTKSNKCGWHIVKKHLWNKLIFSCRNTNNVTKKEIYFYFSYAYS